MPVTASSWQDQNLKPVVITTEDRRQLGGLLIEDDSSSEPQAINELDELLDEATYVDPREAPDNLVTLNTTVELADVASGERHSLTLSSPDAAELFDDSVSVMTPLGMALLGCSVGDVIQCSDSGGEFVVRRIIYQPEHSLTATERGALL